MHRRISWTGGLLIWGGINGFGWAQSQTAPSLRCTLDYAGAAQTLEVKPAADPYTVPSVDVGGFGRFRFKAVVVGEGERIDRIALYVYQNAKP